MIDIPVGKALIATVDPVGTDWDKRSFCHNCFFYNTNDSHRPSCLRGRFLLCNNTVHLEGGKNMIFKLVDWPGEDA